MNKKFNIEIDNVDFWSPHEGNKGGMRIYWSANIGFGTLDIVKRKGNDGEDFESPYEETKLEVYTECIGKEFVKEVLEKLIDSLEIVE